MFAARAKENLAFSHQHGAALKQQQGQTGRPLAPKTPGAKVPLNDENGAHAKTSKALKGADMSSLATPLIGSFVMKAYFTGVVCLTVNRTTIASRPW
jgi:hypothetical protein